MPAECWFGLLGRLAFELAYWDQAQAPTPDQPQIRLHMSLEAIERHAEARRRLRAVECNTDGEALPENFARFAVLDAQCSRTYIANNELTIAPEGLELPARVAREVDRVQQHLKTRATQSRPDRSVLEALVTESPSGLFVKSLSATTTSTDIDEHTRFTESDAKRLEVVAGELASLRHDAPSETRKRLATETTNLQSLRAYVATIDQTVSDSSVAQLQQAAKDVSDGEAAAQTMRAITDGATRDEA